MAAMLILVKIGIGSKVITEGHTDTQQVSHYKAVFPNENQPKM
jgi:hypothetical protein